MPECRELYKYDELTKEQRDKIWAKEINDYVIAAIETHPPGEEAPWHEPTTPWFDAERYYDMFEPSITEAVGEELDKALFTASGDLVGYTDKRFIRYLKECDCTKPKS